MQVANVSTSTRDVRSEIDGWSFEDANLLVRQPDPSNPRKIFIGYTPEPKDIPYYTCVLEMLADGWELLGPPQYEEWEANGTPHTQWGWWLQRRCPPPRSIDKRPPLYRIPHTALPLEGPP